MTFNLDNIVGLVFDQLAVYAENSSERTLPLSLGIAMRLKIPDRCANELFQRLSVGFPGRSNDHDKRPNVEAQLREERASAGTP